MPIEYPWRVSSKIEAKCNIENWTSVLLMHSRVNGTSVEVVCAKPYQVEIRNNYNMLNIHLDFNK